MKKSGAFVNPFGGYAKRFDKELSFNDLLIFTGWSRATLRRRMLESDFPPPTRIIGRKRVWMLGEMLEWVSKFNLRNEIGPFAASHVEEELENKKVSDESFELPDRRALFRWERIAYARRGR